MISCCWAKEEKLSRYFYLMMIFFTLQKNPSFALCCKIGHRFEHHLQHRKASTSRPSACSWSPSKSMKRESIRPNTWHWGSSSRSWHQWDPSNWPLVWRPCYFYNGNRPQLYQTKFRKNIFLSFCIAFVFLFSFFKIEAVPFSTYFRLSYLVCGVLMHDVFFPPPGVDDTFG